MDNSQSLGSQTAALHRRRSGESRRYDAYLREDMMDVILLRVPPRIFPRNARTRAWTLCHDGFTKLECCCSHSCSPSSLRTICARCVDWVSLKAGSWCGRRISERA